MSAKFLSLQKVQNLQTSISFLETYDGPGPDEIHHIGPSLESKDEALTDAFRELGEINKRRTELINLIMNANG